MRANYMIVCLLQSFFHCSLTIRISRYCGPGWKVHYQIESVSHTLGEWNRAVRDVLYLSMDGSTVETLQSFQIHSTDTRSCLSIIKMEICPPHSHCFWRGLLSFFRVEPCGSASHGRLRWVERWVLCGYPGCQLASLWYTKMQVTKLMWDFMTGPISCLVRFI